MNPNAKAWADALESGNYEQGTDWLEKDGKLCCLGVACRLLGATVCRAWPDGWA